jgi:hypothetical protein
MKIMVTVREFRRPVLTAAVFSALGLALVSTAAPALADDAIDVKGLGPANVGVQYRCDASSGASAIKAMVGAPNADSPSATGTQDAITCDGSNQSTVVVLTGEPLSAGKQVQIRVALVKNDDSVVSGKNVLTTPR